jgi:hypothetical protein
VIPILAVDEIGVKRIDPQFPLGLLRAVTTVTMLLKERRYTRERNGFVGTQHRGTALDEEGGAADHPSKCVSAKFDHGKNLRTRRQEIIPCPRGDAVEPM